METAYEAISAEQREQLILQHLPQVKWIAGCLHERLIGNVDEEDLISAGLLGLIAAIDNYDPAKKACLRTYAEFKIRGAILDSVRGLDGVPPHRRKELRRIQEASAAVAQRNLSEPSEEEIASELGIALPEYHRMLDDLKGISLGSLDAVTAEDCDGGLMRYIADDREEPVDVVIEREQLRCFLSEGIAAMPQTEQNVLDLYYRHELSLAEIGQVMGVHLSRICQLKTQATIRLRAWMTKRLRPSGVPK